MHRLFFDIETVADMDVVRSLPDPAPDSRLKDPEKIKKSIEQKKMDRATKAALHPDTAQIVAIGMAKSLDPENIFVEVDFTDERRLLTSFWEHFGGVNGQCVGFNILGFDLPVILRRSMKHDLLVPTPILRRYQVEPITDLMMILAGWDRQSYQSLKYLAKIYDLGVDFDEQEHGGNVMAMTDEQLKVYVEKDVQAVQMLFMLMNGIYFDLSTVGV